MEFKEDLDRWITKEPDDDFPQWTEEVWNCLTDDFYNVNSRWLDEYDGQYNKWLNLLYNKGKEPKESASIIEKAHKFYKL
jgi:hypothetical protein